MSITITDNSVFFDKNDIVLSDSSLGTTEGFRTVISGDLSPFKNRIINGDMSVNQRVSSSAQSAIANNYPVVVDRFRLYNSESQTLINAERAGGDDANSTPEGHTHYLRCTTLAAVSLTGTVHVGVYTAIEGYDLLDFFYGTANTFGNQYSEYSYSSSIQPCPGILSFWVRTSVPGSYSVGIKNGSSDRVLIQRFSADSTWKKIFIFVPPCGDGNWATDNTVGMYITWNLGIGTTTYRARNNEVGHWTNANYLGAEGQTNLVTGPIGSTFDITGIQFEKCLAPSMPCWIVKGIDIAANGLTGLSQIHTGDLDDGFFQINLPFPITYLGVVYNTIYVGTNGYISFQSGFNSYPAALTNAAGVIASPHLGFFKGDKRLTNLSAGMVTKSLGATYNQSNVYIVRWEGYNYGGASSNKTIVEIWFYENKLNDNNIIDVVYVQNQNTTEGTIATATFLEINDQSTGNSSGTYYPLQYIMNKSTGLTTYRIVLPTAKVVKSSGSDLYWNSSVYFADYSISISDLVNDEIYTRIGASTYTFTDKHTEFLKCQRYYQKTYNETIPVGVVSGIHYNYGLYPYYRDGTASTVVRYIPYIYAGDMRTTPNVTLYDYEGNIGKASSDGIHNYAAGASAIGTNACFLYHSSSMPSHYSYYGFAVLDAEM